MKRSYIAIRGVLLALISTIPAHAQPDTVVLNRTQFRFPETHPGKVFTVSKIIVNGQQGLKKGQSEALDATPALSPSKAAVKNSAGRDPLGRVLKTGEYASRMARIEKAHKLPTVARVAGKGETRIQDGFIPNELMGEDARFLITSDSPLIQNAQDLVKLEQAEREAMGRKYGALGKAFTERVQAMRATDSLDISIELKIEHPGFLNAFKATKEERIANGRAWAYAKPIVEPAEFLRRRGLKSTRDENMPRPGSRITEARASREQILGLAREGSVVSVMERPRVVTTAVPWSGNPVQSSGQCFNKSLVRHVPNSRHDVG